MAQIKALLAALLLAAPACAEMRPVVYGGRPVVEPSPLWRSVVAVDMDPGDYTGILPCSGVLIAPHIVLTAAHCAKPPAGGRLISVGLYDAAGAVRLKFPIVADKVRVHPDYDAESSRNDVAVAAFLGDLPDGYAPAGLLADAAPLRKGAEIEIAGVGQTEAGQTAGLRFGRLFIKEVHDADKAFSAVEPAESVMACSGDSGGPAFLNGTVAGVIFLAWEPKKHPCSGPGTAFMASVPHHKAWIDGAVAELTRLP